MLIDPNSVFGHPLYFASLQSVSSAVTKIINNMRQITDFVQP